MSLTWLDGEGEYEVIRWIVVVRTRVPAPVHAQYVIIHLRQPPIQSVRLTLFLTTLGSLRFKSLPTGAGSPALFAEVSHCMLHYQPVLDENGKPVFESSNVMKQEPIAPWETLYLTDDIVITSTAKPTYRIAGLKLVRPFTTQGRADLRKKSLAR